MIFNLNHIIIVKVRKFKLYQSDLISDPEEDQKSNVLPKNIEIDMNSQNIQGNCESWKSHYIDKNNSYFENKLKSSKTKFINKDDINSNDDVYKNGLYLINRGVWAVVNRPDTQNDPRR